MIGGGLLCWSFYWEERCNKGLERLYLRLPAPNDQRLRIGGPDLGARLRRRPRFWGCEDRGQPPRLAAWP